MKIQPIVEGHGDVAAFPVLLRRLVAEARAWSIGIGRPIQVPRGKLVQQAEVERAVLLAVQMTRDSQPNGSAGVWCAGLMSQFGVVIELVVERGRGHHHGVVGRVGDVGVVGVAQFGE